MTLANRQLSQSEVGSWFFAASVMLIISPPFLVALTVWFAFSHMSLLVYGHLFHFQHLPDKPISREDHDLYSLPSIFRLNIVKPQCRLWGRLGAPVVQYSPNRGFRCHGDGFSTNLGKASTWMQQVKCKDATGRSRDNWYFTPSNYRLNHYKPL